MTALNHIALGAQDPEELARFYVEVFGREELARHFDDAGALRSVWVDLGGTILMVERTIHARPRVEGVDAGLFLLAFDVKPSERGALEATLATRGCTIEDRTGFTSYTRDPEGNRIAISHYPHTNDVVAAYDRVADVYAGDAEAEDDPAWREACRQLFMKRLAGKRVLEVGSGPGVDAARLAEAGLEVTATDGATRFVEILEERYGDRMRVGSLDLLALPEDLGPFDGIYAHSCFIHVPRDHAPTALSRLHDALVDGGVLFLAVARGKWPSYVVENWGGTEGNDVEFHYYDADELEALLKQAGFSEVERYELDWSEDSVYRCGPPAERIRNLEIRPHQLVAIR